MSDIYNIEDEPLTYEEVLAILEAELVNQSDYDNPFKPLNFHTEDDEEEWDLDEDF